MFRSYYYFVILISILFTLLAIGCDEAGNKVDDPEYVGIWKRGVDEDSDDVVEYWELLKIGKDTIIYEASVNQDMYPMGEAEKGDLTVVDDQMEFKMIYGWDASITDTDNDGEIDSSEWQAYSSPQTSQGTFSISNDTLVLNFGNGDRIYHKQ